MTPHHRTRGMILKERIALLEEIEPLCRAVARLDDRRCYTHHMIDWRTPAGSGVTGLPLYLIERDGEEVWAISRTPCQSAQTWPTVVSHLLDTWRRPAAGIDHALALTLPPCGCAAARQERECARVIADAAAQGDDWCPFCPHDHAPGDEAARG